MLYDNMSHFNIFETYNKLKELNIISINELVDYLSQKLFRSSYSAKSIMQNVLMVNTYQAKQLQTNNFEITYNSTLEKNLKEKNSVLDFKMRSIKKRSIVLYFRGSTDKKHSMSVDAFHMVILYKVLDSLIKRKGFQIFNDLYIVSSDPLTESYETFKKNNVPVEEYIGDTFITSTCLFANTIHFTGGELPDLHSYTIPLISKYILDYNNLHIPKHFKNFVRINVIYPELIFKKDGSYIFNTDLESAYKGELCSWEHLFNKRDFKESYSAIRNTTVIGLVEEIVEKLHEVENKMLTSL